MLGRYFLVKVTNDPIVSGSTVVRSQLQRDSLWSNEVAHEIMVLRSYNWGQVKELATDPETAGVLDLSKINPVKPIYRIIVPFNNNGRVATTVKEVGSLNEVIGYCNHRSDFTIEEIYSNSLTLPQVKALRRIERLNEEAEKEKTRQAELLKIQEKEIAQLRELRKKYPDVVL